MKLSKCLAKTVEPGYLARQALPVAILVSFYVILSIGPDPIYRYAETFPASLGNERAEMDLQSAWTTRTRRRQVDLPSTDLATGGVRPTAVTLMHRSAASFDH